jgi:hypothetical protein
MTPHFSIDIRFRLHTNARQVSFYPGARLTEPVWPISRRMTASTCCRSSCPASP